MTHDDAHTSHNHGFELPNAPIVVVRTGARRWRAVAGVAVCLGLAGIVAGLIVARRQSVSDEHLTSDALQREELRDGWRALGAAAAQDAQARSMPANTAATATATAAPAPNVVVVNVPAPSAAAAPPAQNVTNINLPNGSTPGTVVAPAESANAATGYAPNQSLPPVNFSPVPGYLPVQPGYTTPSSNGQTGNLPQYNYGTSTGTVPSFAPPVGNGSIPGSTPNPALPNNGLVGSPPVPGLPNGPVNGSPTPSAPIGTVPTSPGTPSLPSGFSAP